MLMAYIHDNDNHHTDNEYDPKTALGRTLSVVFDVDAQDNAELEDMVAFLLNGLGEGAEIINITEIT